jgi:hypothetical protein
MSSRVQAVSEFRGEDSVGSSRIFSLFNRILEDPRNDSRVEKIRGGLGGLEWW